MKFVKIGLCLFFSIIMVVLGVRFEKPLNYWNDVFIKGEVKEPFSKLHLNHYDAEVEVWDIFDKLSSKEDGKIFKGGPIVGAEVNSDIVRVAFNSGLIMRIGHDGSLINSNDISMLLNDFVLFKKNGGIRTVLWLMQDILFVYYTAQFQSGEEYELRIALINSEQRVIYDEVVLGQFKEEEHFALGGGAVFDESQSKIFIAIGATMGTDDMLAGSKAQNDAEFFGKTISVELVGNSKLDPSGLKFLKPVIVSKGHRNPQGMTIFNGDLLSVEHGPRGGDELNLIKKNGNYGWNHFSYGNKYGQPDSDYDNWSKDFVEPSFYFTPSIGISDVYPCPSTFLLPGYNNCVLISSMHDASFYVAKFFKGTSFVQSIERVDLGERIRKIRSFDDTVFLFTDCIIRKCKQKIVKIRYSEFR